MKNLYLGKYLTLEQFCTCSKTYQKYSSQIDPWPQQKASIQALQDLNQYLLDPIIAHYGSDSFQLTYGFCSADLRRYLNQKDPVTGEKNGRIDPRRDQHMACELNRNGRYYCDRRGAACDFSILGTSSDQVVSWIIEQQLPFDSLYYYGSQRPIHLSHGPQHKKALWTFTPTGQPTRKGIEPWLSRLQELMYQQTL
ncbi:hypothetical protein PN462_07210 [Spirulina sp. CS-785/01]|uniref:hypothetical protein n=1 Tax=Spirulina sp. CS-785/01 TaxID=3021716 RepID=UPI00232CDC66|nr:hypothetical protein [Spirulina sp. CS-785/01]MDB9312884.1 hypothetical protein [Spirulina sp. CS-785/01]